MTTIITKECKEEKVKKKLRELCKEHDAFPTHIPSGLYGSGAADYVILNKYGETIYIECKSPVGKQTLKQKIFQQEIEKRKGCYLLYNGLNDNELLNYLHTPRLLHVKQNEGINDKILGMGTLMLGDWAEARSHR